MTSVDLWAAVDRDVGVPVTFFLDSGGDVVTNAPGVVTARGCRADTGAAGNGEPGGASASMSLVRHALTRHLDLTSSAVRAREGGFAVIDLASDAWLERCGLGAPSRAHLEQATADVRRTRPSLRRAGAMRAWDDMARETGLDSLVWAALLSASRTAPLTLGHAVETLASRRDDNPLARARRAHAAATLRTGPARTVTGETSAAGPTPSAPLRAAIWLTSRAFHDAARRGRTRPALDAVDDLAAAMLRHVERAPVTRTDLLALAAARSIVHECLDAVGVASPVPY